jgi:RNA polymerase sigma-70 factor (ECF subfamily)
MSHSDFQNSSKTNSFSDQSNIVKVIDEEALIRKFFESDPKQGCKVLFQKYYKILCSHAVRFVYSKEIAEDIVSEIFCKFWSDQLYLKVNLSYRAYLFKAVRYGAYNYIRWELSKRKNDVDFANLEEQFKSLRPEDTMLIDELSEEINRTIDNLPAQCKKVFMLSRFENRKYSEIAAELGISIKAVEAHISKALDTLRTKLKSSDLLTLFFLTCLSEF